jgi:hypothetical protein
MTPAKLPPEGAASIPILLAAKRATGLLDRKIQVSIPEEQGDKFGKNSENVYFLPNISIIKLMVPLETVPCKWVLWFYISDIKQVCWNHY